jgi:hypothetical protein
MLILSALHASVLVMEMTIGAAPAIGIAVH